MKQKKPTKKQQEKMNWNELIDAIKEEEYKKEGWIKRMTITDDETIFYNENGEVEEVFTNED